MAMAEREIVMSDDPVGRKGVAEVFRPPLIKKVSQSFLSDVVVLSTNKR